MGKLADQNQKRGYSIQDIKMGNSCKSENVLFIIDPDKVYDSLQALLGCVMKDTSFEFAARYG